MLLRKEKGGPGAHSALLEWTNAICPAARARTGSADGPAAGLSRDLASGIIGGLAAGLDSGIALAGGCF